MIFPEPGDILFIRTNHFVSKLIRFGQRGYGKEAAQWNHVAVYIGDGEIVEALTRGIVRSPSNKYPMENVETMHVIPRVMLAKDTLSGDNMRCNALGFAYSCIGEKYGFLTILAIAIKVLTKGKIDFGIQGTSICSGLAARSLERLGYNFNPYDPAELTPAYLYTVLP